jgi:hypothetical protein
MKYLPLLLLASVMSCASMEPDYFELSPYGQRGSHNFTRPVSSFDEDTWGVMATLGWNIGEQARAMSNLARLDVSQGGELTMRDGPGHSFEFNTSASSEQDAEVKSLIDLPDEDRLDEEAMAEEHFIPIPDVPDDTEGGIAVLLWAFAVVLLAFAATILHKAGLRLPFFPDHKKSD